MGYLVSAEIPKSKQCKQIVCLHCVNNLLGVVGDSADGLSVTLSGRKDGGREATLMERQTRDGAWTQTLKLTDELIAFLHRENARTVSGQRQISTAATQIGSRGMAKGVRPRAGGGASNEVVDQGALSVKEQAMRYLKLMICPEESARMYLPTGSASPPLRLYMTSWDHNGEGRLKGLGKPDKVHGLPESVWWNALGKLCCTCNRGRLMEDAPCVHKLAMAALSESWVHTAELPTCESLGRGARLERIGSDATGSYFAVADNLQGALGPQRRMLFRSCKGVWYCEGRRDGCASLTDCSHVSAAKAAMRSDHEGAVAMADRLILSPLEPFSRASLSWLERWEGGLPEIGEVPAAVPPLQGGSDGGLKSEERYLVGLLEKRPHEPAKCAGDSCFCRQHERLFGEAAAQPMVESRIERDVEQGGAGEVHPRKRARRSKALWAAHRGSQHTEAPAGWDSKPPADARGKVAIRGWVDACASCTLASLARDGRCEHGEVSRVRVPVMLLTTEATQVTKPKLARLSDAVEFHDPLVTSLERPVRVSKLRDCHLEELSEKGLLSAPCPLEAPRCGGAWEEAWVAAAVTASSWSQQVRVRIYHCRCLDEAHAVHFDGEHLGLYAWNRRTIFVQESLQLLLRGMQHGHSFKAELATSQAAFQRSPDAIVLSEETWRRASLDYFKLVGLGIRDCCSLCGPHPKVLLCDGIVGLASTDGAKKPGGLGSGALDARRTFCHPSRHSNGEILEKRSISGRDFCGAGLDGGGMKRKLLLQPELREALARLSQHRPKDEKLGQRLSKAEFGALLDGLAHEDPQIVKRFGPNQDEGPLAEDGRRRLLKEQQTMVRDRNLAVFELLTGIQEDFERRGRNV